MGRAAGKYDDIDAALAGARYVPYYTTLVAVRIELGEDAKPKRGMQQAEVARMFRVTPRALRYWVKRYAAEGAEGLRARGGQGRKRDVSREDVAAAISDSIEAAMDGADGGGDPSCSVCLAEAADGKDGGGPGARRDPPKACRCRGGCAGPGPCRCGPKKVCRCKCCRPLKLPPRGPRHDPGCTGRRVEARGATRAAFVRDPISARHGKKYHLHHVHKLLKDNGVAYHKVSKVQSSHAGAESVQARIGRQEARLAPYRERGCTVGVPDIAFVGTGGGTGCMRTRRGARAVLPNSGSRQAAAPHGAWLQGRRHCARELGHADSATLISFLKTASAAYGRPVLCAGRPSIHSSAETKKFLREHRRLRPDRDMRLFLPPRGSPCLRAIGAFWNSPKDAVSKRCRHKPLDALRWAAMEYARTVRLRLDLYKFLYRDPRKHALASQRPGAAAPRPIRRRLRRALLPPPAPRLPAAQPAAGAALPLRAPGGPAVRRMAADAQARCGLQRSARRHF